MNSTDPLERAVYRSLAESMDEEARDPIHLPETETDRQDWLLDRDQPQEEDAFGRREDPSESTILPSRMPRRSTAQTGPKGVLADYKLHQRLEWERKQLEKRLLVKKIKEGSMSLQLAPAQEHEEDEDELLRALEEEQDLQSMQAYREQRIQEIMDQRKSQRMKPKFGFVREIAVTDYVNQVENEPPMVTVLVHLYEPDIPACMALNQTLPILARRYGYTKFLRIRASEADPDFDTIALPTLIVYRGCGQVQDTCIRLTDDLEPSALSRERVYGGLVGSPAFDVDEVERFLLRRGALRDEDICDMLLPPSTAS